MKKDHPDTKTQEADRFRERIITIDSQRRRFAKGGVGATVVIATLASRPALAGICKSPSGFASGNLSHPGMTDCSPGKAPADWVDSNAAAELVFHDVFQAGPKANWGEETTFAGVLVAPDNGNSTDVADDGRIMPNPISKEFVAAWLNILDHSYPTGLNEENIKHIWDEWVQTGQYEVRAGLFWTAEAHIIPYLQYLHS
jgi:hypothetical protein